MSSTQLVKRIEKMAFGLQLYQFAFKPLYELYELKKSKSGLNRIKKDYNELYLLIEQLTTDKIDNSTFEKSFKTLLASFNNEFKEMLSLINKEKSLSDFCGFKIYEENIQKRYDTSVLSMPDYDYEQFLFDEWNKFSSLKSISNFLNNSNKKSFEDTINKKIQHIEKLISDKNYQVLNRNKEISEEEILDFMPKLSQVETSKEIDANINDLIIILDQLDVFAKIKEMNPNISVLNISTLISVISSKNKDSINPLINTLLSQYKTKNSRHPYYSSKSKERVKELFRSLNIPFKEK